MKHFRFSIIFTIICLAISAYWGFTHGPEAGLSAMFKVLAITSILAIMEVSLSFDNAVVNASVNTGTNFGEPCFLTVGIIVAVFGMRLVFPLLIVGVTADMGMIEVAKLALNDPKSYSEKLMAHHAEIAAFGGMFLLLVFLNFLFDDEKDEHWFHWLESRLADLGNIQAISVFISLVALLVLASFIPDASRLVVVMAGIWGIVVYVGVKVIGHLLEGSSNDDESEKSNGASATGTIVKGGIGGFLYLEVLDASFSFDGVIGAFAITSDVVIIMLGLAIGAMFVRSMTIYLVEKGTLDAYIFRTWCTLCNWCTCVHHVGQRHRTTYSRGYYRVGGLPSLFGLLSLQFHIVKSNNLHKLNLIRKQRNGD